MLVMGAGHALLLGKCMADMGGTSAIPSYLEMQTTPCAPSISLTWSSSHTPGFMKDSTTSAPVTSIVLTLTSFLLLP